MKKFLVFICLCSICSIFTGCGSNKISRLELEKEVETLISENEALQKELTDIRKELEYIKNGSTNLIVQIRNYKESNDIENLLKLSEQLHKDFNGSNEDIEAQGYVAEINKKKEEEEQKKLEAESKSKEEKLRDIIRIEKVRISSINSAGGVSLNIGFTNNSGKTIKYIDFSCSAINAVGDTVECTIRRLYQRTAQAVGPYEKGQGDDLFWDSVWYNSTAKSVKINKISIQYTDNSIETISGADVDLVIY